MLWLLYFGFFGGPLAVSPTATALVGSYHEITSFCSQLDLKVHPCGDCSNVVQQCLHQPVNESGLHGVESLRGRTAATPQTETRLASYDGMARALCFPSLSAASSYYIYRHIDGSYQSLITYTMPKTCSFGCDILFHRYPDHSRKRAGIWSLGFTKGLPCTPSQVT